MLTAPFGLRYESVDKVGAWLEAETCFSRPRLSRGEPAVPIPKSSTAAACARFFLPHNLQATMARPPMRIAPPIPPTTPPTTALVFGDMVLPPPPPEPPLASVGSMVAVATSVEETTRELVRTADLTVPSSVKYEVVVKGSVDSRTMFEVIVVLDEKVDGSMVLLPMTTRGSSSSVTVSTADVPVRVADRVTGMDDVMVLPSLSVVVTAV